MPYPNSPFSSDFDAQMLFKLNDDENSTLTALQNEELKTILKWLCTTPEVTTYRVNTLKTDPEDVIKLIQSHILNVLGPNSIKIERHQLLKDVIILYNPKMHHHLEAHSKEIIVDVDCAAAVLRGAHIYAPGVLGMMAGIQIDDNVSIYADISRKCKQGQQTYDHPKVFIANGIVKMSRYQLFSYNYPKEKKGIAVDITETISNCPSLGDDFLPPGMALLQNLPSIVCAYVLNPQPHDVILDMCASPGNKTTHIAALMKNQGILIAIDKTPNKVKMLEKRCAEFGAKVKVFQADSTKLVKASSENLLGAPPFPPNSFDRILLDGPCSALGKRPQLRNSISRKVLLSYRPLQKKLFENALQLLKNNGVLVYSTCTLTLGENEGIVEWALNTFKCLQLVKAEPIFGGPGLKIDNLEGDKLQRFGPQQNDSIGFFIAKFVKKQ